MCALSCSCRELGSRSPQGSPSSMSIHGVGLAKPSPHLEPHLATWDATEGFHAFPGLFLL